MRTKSIMLGACCCQGTGYISVVWLESNLCMLQGEGGVMIRQTQESSVTVGMPLLAGVCALP